MGQAEIVETDHTQIPYVISAPTMRVPMILKDSVNVYLAIRAALGLIKYGVFENGTAIGDKVKVVAFSGMSTGVGQVSPEIFARQMKQAIENVIEEKHAYPLSWWDAAQVHQLLYSDEEDVRDLQQE